MKRIKPVSVFLSFLLVVAILLGLSWTIPTDGITVFGVNLKFPTIERLLHPKKQESANIDNLVALVDTSLVETDPLVKYDGKSGGNLGAPSGGEISVKDGSIIHLSESAKSSLFAFFEKLSSAASEKKKIHILHYGDSQIEGDRMTGFIRERMQTQFGGYGPGLVPAMNVYSTYAFMQNLSPNFVRYTCFGGAKLGSRKYGVMGSAARFTPELKDSASIAAAQAIQTGWIEVGAHGSARSRSKTFNTVKMFYNGCIKPCAINVYENGKIIHQDSLIADGKYHVFKLSFPATPGKLKFEFKSAISPNISNFSLEGDYGLQVSNIGMRGSSGTIFGAMDRAIVGQAMSDLNTELIIMQFGGNSVPSFKDSTSVRNFVSYFKGQLRTLKAMRPSAAIVVIGPSDMSRFSEGIYETYPLLPYCVEKMRIECTDAGAGYWDLYAAMGGKNSMPAWVQKGLAGKDYIHFSNGGANVAAQMFYDALMKAYVEWKGATGG